MVYMSRSATCGTIGSVLLSRLRAWGLSPAEGSSHVGGGLRTTPMYLHGWRKARWNRAEIEEFCAAWNVPCSGGGEDGGLLQVVLTLLSPFFFYKAIYRSMEGMAICHHLFYFICFYSFFLFYFSVSGVGNYCSLSPETVFLNNVHWGES